MPTALVPVSTQRQQLLFLYLSHPSPAAATIAWSLHDGAGEGPESPPGDQDRPPYASVVAAMRDGWRVIQVAPNRPPYPGAEQTTSFLPYEFVLERFVETAEIAHA